MKTVYEVVIKKLSDNRVLQSCALVSTRSEAERVRAYESSRIETRAIADAFVVPRNLHETAEEYGPEVE